jgi:hypothetical protein
VIGVEISRSSGRAHAYVTAPWSTEVRAALVEHEVQALTLLPAPEVRNADGLADVLEHFAIETGEVRG